VKTNAKEMKTKSKSIHRTCDKNAKKQRENKQTKENKIYKCKPKFAKIAGFVSAVHFFVASFRIVFCIVIF